MENWEYWKDEINTSIVDILTEKIEQVNDAPRQRIAVNKITEYANEHNSKQIKTIKQVPVTNIHNEFQAYLIGFNGRSHKMNVMFDSGCMPDAIISPKLSKLGYISSDVFGCSFVFVLCIDNIEYIFTGISQTKGRIQTCMVEGKRYKGISTQNAGHYEDEPIDLLIGYNLLIQMEKLGIVCVATPFENITKITKIPISEERGLEMSLNGIPIKTHFDSGNFVDVDLMVTLDWFNKNRKYFPEIKNNEHCFITSFSVCSITYNMNKFEFENVKVMIFPEMPIGYNGIKIDCIPTLQFMKLLAKENIYPFCDM